MCHPYDVSPSWMMSNSWDGIIKKNIRDAKISDKYLW